MELVGKKIGKALVIELIGEKSTGKYRSLKVYKCLCDCGEECMLSREQLTRNGSPACKKCSRNHRFIDLSGRKFGKWMVIERDISSKEKVSWMCECECGNKKSLIPSVLKNGHSKSCGCFWKEVMRKERIDLIGRKFGRLLVIGRADRKGKWECECDCGKRTIVYAPSLYSGSSKSCGCIRVENLSGENSIFWKGGITDETRQLKHSYKFQRWSKLIKRRDNKECKKCFSKEKLHAHHIINYSFDPSMALVIDNGITLCETCHKEFHRINGVKENNKYQLNIFLKI